jgi:hypothetical protein
LQRAFDSLVHKGVGNSNREKLGEEQEALIFSLYANGDAKLNEVQVHAMYLNMASRKITAGEWDHRSIISLSTIKNFLSRKDIKQAYWKPRHGRQAYRADFEVITHRRAPTVANSLWVMDGTPVHRYYMHNGRAYARLNVYVILDAHSWCVLGFFISENETGDSVKGALRSACELTQFLPHQIMFDHGSANMSLSTTTCMQAIARHLTPTIVGNARSKIIEPFFKHLNNSVLRFRPGYTHSPVMSNHINGKPNPEALQKAVKGDNIPRTKEQAIRELHEDFALWNNKPFNGSKSPLQRYQESTVQHANLQRPYTNAERIEAFYTMPGTEKLVKVADEQGAMRQMRQFFPQPYSYTNDGIAITIDKVPHIFQTDDPEFNRRHIGRSFLVKYDEIELQHTGLKQIYLYENTPNGARPFIIEGNHASLRNPHLYAHALMDRVAGEGHLLHEHLNNKKVQELKNDQIAQRYMRLSKATGTFMEIRADNAYPKDVINAAKQQIAEQIINGDQETDRQVADEVEASKNHSGPTTKPDTVPASQRRSRWDLE